MTTTHFTAWLTTDASCLDQPNIDVTVLEDELIGDNPANDGAWSSQGDPLFHAVTGVPAADSSTGRAEKEAQSLLEAAGWTVEGDWEPVPTGGVVTVSRATN
ncbi:MULTISPECIES: hypothetical protein [unclassified Streptomyces]|uniref:hypothetical protein n=1 Tax=unclassified Streptomyces TaxID=2593676 RepID=UPI00088EB058|nr:MULTISPECIES: hypothetical protein [unclassified Streptomyces]PBC72309.1 hypothetical protein BX261_7393 [Streptomyces sp. 2321.6]SDR62219.1 hypothetical protein SAMN05216511_7310 [Streptomyces sp. KS_16]SEE51121.1 hypothetical protein SAMN05428940_7359 [Streptomyces sp. 2133.1]SNC77813.1 hypothetical protein SAMN06272741_7229 [Streptomyces sp. 2114.4]